MITPCDVCGNVELNWDRGWAVSDQEWRQVVPEKWRDKTLCPWCFVKFAAEQGKEYQVTFYPWDPSIASGVKRVEDDFCHELKHHIDYKKRGIEQLIESLKCRWQKIPHWSCPIEERADKYAIRKIVSDKYLNKWKRKVEPIIGKDRIGPRLV